MFCLKLQACTSVVAGKVRGRQQTLKDGDYAIEDSSRVGDKVLCVQVHGDASFTAQVNKSETRKSVLLGKMKDMHSAFYSFQNLLCLC